MFLSTYFFFLGLTGFADGAGFPGVTDTFITSSKPPVIANLLSYLSAHFYNFYYQI